MLAGKQLRALFLKLPSSAHYGSADSRPLPTAQRPSPHPRGASRAANVRQSGRRLARVPGSGKGEEGRERPARGPGARCLPDPRGAPAQQPLLPPGESSAEDPSAPPSLPAISAPVSAPKWLPPTNRCDSIPAEPRSARAPRSPGPSRCLRSSTPIPPPAPARPPARQPSSDLTAPAARPRPGATAPAKFLEQAAHLSAGAAAGSTGREQERASRRMCKRAREQERAAAAMQEEGARQLQPRRGLTVTSQWRGQPIRARRLDQAL